jgi:hypothetical protein
MAQRFDRGPRPRRGFGIGPIGDRLAASIVEMSVYGLSISEVQLATGASERTIRTVMVHALSTLTADIPGSNAPVIHH